MGYDVHLVKPQIGGQQADEFSDREWLAFQQKHPVKPWGRWAREGIAVLCRTTKEGRHESHRSEWQYPSNSSGVKLSPAMPFQFAMVLSAQS